MTNGLKFIDYRKALINFNELSRVESSDSKCKAPLFVDGDIVKSI